jgi:hypothetical protein
MNRPGDDRIMADRDAGGSPALMARVRELSAADTWVPHRELQGLFEQQVDHQGLSLAEWHEVVSFASDQCGRWQARWLFSPAATPDRAAKQEFDGWRLLYVACAEALLARVPEVRERLDRRHEMTALRHALGRRLQQTEGRTLHRIGSAVLSQAAGAVRRLGLRHLAGRLEAAALYPSGSVGRR